MSLLKQFLIGFVIIFLLLFLHYLSWLRPAENIIIRTIGPAQQKVYSASNNLKFFYNNWLTRRNLLAENEKLIAQLKNYEVDQATLNSLMEENALLKKELDFVKENQTRYVAAKIITGVSDPLSQSVVINRGSNSGIKKGFAVIADHGVFIGKVSEVYGNASKVLLLTDNNSKVAATIQNSDHTAGLVEGQFGLSFSMTNIPQTEDIKEGDLVVSSGLEGNIPKNLLIAKIDGINQKESEIFKSATLQPIIPFANLSDVLVVIP